MASTSAASTPPTFSFANPTPAAASTTPSLFGAATSNAGTGFSFATKPATDAAGTSKPSFSFGPAPTAAPAASPFPAFSLSGAQPSAASGSSFSAPASSATTPAATPAASFSFAGFGQPAAASKPAATPPAAPTPAPTFSFAPAASSAAPAQPSAAAASSATPPKLGGGNLFSGFGAASTTPASTPNNPPAQAKPAAPVTPVPTFNLGGAANNVKKPSPLGAQSPIFPTSPAVSSTPTSQSTTSTSAPLSFGTGTAPAASSKPAVPLFGAATSSTTPTTTSAASSSTAPASLPTFTLGKPAATPQSNPASTASLTASAVAPKQPSVLSGMRLDEIVNRWTTDLDERIKEFMGLAAEVKAWDAILIANGDVVSFSSSHFLYIIENSKIATLSSQLQQTEPTQQKITSSLDYVETQQKELSTVLDAYEQQVTDILGPGDGQSHLVGADAERERAYRIAESLNTQLDEMSRSLGALIQDVNGLSQTAGLVASGTDDNTGDNNATADPVAQIAAILNAHLAGLTWIESQSDALRSQIDDMEGKVKNVAQGQWPGLRSSRASARTGNRTLNSPQQSLYSYGRR